jgi:hypothetical protein
MSTTASTRSRRPPGGELVVQEVHRPDVVGPDRRLAIVAQLRLHTPLGRLVAQLQAQLRVQPVGPFMVHPPALALEQHLDAPIAVADAYRADLLDACLEAGLVGSA